MTQEVLLAKFVWVVGYSSTEGFFDTANHDVLLKKLEHVIKVITNSWFQSYLNDRMKFTTVNKCQSSKKIFDVWSPTMISFSTPSIYFIYQ